MKLVMFLVAALGVIVPVQTAAKKYTGPKVSEPYAVLRMTGSQSSSVTSSGVWICSEDTCDPAKGYRVGAFSWGRSTEQTVNIHGDRKIRLVVSYARNSGIAGTPQGVIARSGIPCINIVEFSPVSGNTYDLSQLIDEKAMAEARDPQVVPRKKVRDMRNGIGCTISLLNSSTKQPPDSLVVISAE